MPVSFASNVSPLYQPTASLLPGMGRATAPTKSPPVAIDEFQLSPTAALMQQFLSQTDDGQSDPDNSLSGLERLKQNGELLAGVLQSKLKNFQTNLTSTLQTAGLDPMQAMTMQQGIEGLLLTNTSPDKEQITKLLGKDGSLSKQFQDISRLAELLGALQQSGPQAVATTAAARYARQSQVANTTPDARFVLNVMRGNASYSFE